MMGSRPSAMQEVRILINVPCAFFRASEINRSKNVV